MKVLITGGAGFIGSSVSDRMLELGHKILVVDNYDTGLRENNEPHPNLTIVQASIEDKGKLASVFAEFEPNIVVHAAASFKDPESWASDVHTNVMGTINVIECSRNIKIDKLIYLQTSLSYGLHPMENPITIHHPLLSGGSSYAISKTAAERYIELSGLKYLTFRLANVYGPRNLSGPLPTFYKRLKNDQVCTVVNTRRDFIFIDDIVDLVVKGMQQNFGCYHASTGKDHSVKSLFDFTVKHLGITDPKIKEAVMGPDDTKTILLDPSKTEKDFDWKAKTKLEDGIKRSLSWYNGHSIFRTYTHLKTIN